LSRIEGTTKSSLWLLALPAVYLASMLLPNAELTGDANVTGMVSKVVATFIVLFAAGMIVPILLRRVRWSVIAAGAALAYHGWSIITTSRSVTDYNYMFDYEAHYTIRPGIGIIVRLVLVLAVIVVAVADFVRSGKAS
jgi:hypothetical protein